MKKTIEILGTGCPKCRALTTAADDVARRLGLDYELVKVTEIPDIVARGVMLTPALVVDGEVKVMGRVPLATELERMLG
jgi:small redox-active disulfide protein 2